MECGNGPCKECRVPQFLKEGELVELRRLGDGLARARLRFGTEETIITVPLYCSALNNKSSWWRRWIWV